MNTRKQVLLMSTLLLVALIIVGMYGAWYPYREVDAGKEFEEKTAIRGSILFARNCRLCHGDVGEGGSLGARLPAAPPLNRPDLQGFVDANAKLTLGISAADTGLVVDSPGRLKEGQTILVDEERMTVEALDRNRVTVKRQAGHTEAMAHSANAPIFFLDPAELKSKSTLITNTITCGRVGTAMPPWAQSQGGPLSDEQIRQLMVVITTGRWHLVEEEVDVEDRISARLLEPVSDSATSLRVSDVSVFTEKEAIRLGEERLRVTSVPKTKTVDGRTVEIKDAKDKSGVISVERGILRTSPFDHGVDSVIYRFPETSAPSINQSACGQTARPAAPAGNPEPIEPFEGQTVQVVAQNIAFDLRQITVSASASTQVRVRFDNRDTGVDHNIAFYNSATNISPVSPGSVGLTFTGPGIDDTAFNVPAPGNYFFRCDVHPTIMTGTFTVTP